MTQKIAVVYDWVDKWGGVERVLLNLLEIFPRADFYSSYWDQDKASWAKNFKVKSSFIQKFPKLIRQNRLFSFIFYPLAFESFNFSGYDLVISVSSSFAKGVITQSGIKHICYLLTPTRYLWVYPENYLKKPTQSLLKPYINYIKNWDFVAAQRPDKIISISRTVADRCQKYYQRQSEIIYPPFDINYWNRIKSQITNHKLQINFKSQILKSQFYLVVSRLEPYKKIDYVIETFNQLNKLLIIVGEGSEEKKLKKMASKNIRFLAKLSDHQLAYLYSIAEGLIMPQEEDFGYVAVEAQFFGCPVIAFKKGGVSETVIEGKTSVLFERQTKGFLLSALERYEKISYNLRYLTKKIGPNLVKKFDKELFFESINKSI